MVHTLFPLDTLNSLKLAAGGDLDWAHNCVLPTRTSSDSPGSNSVPLAPVQPTDCWLRRAITCSPWNPWETISNNKYIHVTADSSMWLCLEWSWGADLEAWARGAVETGHSGPFRDSGDSHVLSGAGEPLKGPCSVGTQKSHSKNGSKIKRREAVRIQGQCAPRFWWGQRTVDRVYKYKESSRRCLVINQLWVLQENAGPRARIWWMPWQGESRLRKMPWCWRVKIRKETHPMVTRKHKHEV